MKRFIRFILPILIIPIVSFSVLSTPTYADDDLAFNSYVDSTCNSFLGLVSWNCGVNITNEDSLKTGIWTIVTNVATDLTVIAAYLVIGYVIYGGYLYIFSSGDPGKAATGKKAITHALIGLAITMLANIIMSTIRYALLGEDKTLANCATETCITADDLVINAIHWAIAVSGIVATIFVVYGGISYSTSAGDPGKLQKAKSAITYALIGLAIVALAELITAFVSNIVREASTGAINNTTSIAKELK